VYNIWYFKRKTRRLRKERGLPPLLDEDDLPDPVYDPHYVGLAPHLRFSRANDGLKQVHVLTETEQRDLHYRELVYAVV
jgi:hypothetical protein